MGNYNKYKNIPAVVDGIKFASKAESRRYNELKLLKQAGEIQGFGMQPSFRFASGIRYLPDFIVWTKNRMWVEDVKGKETQVFKNKKRMWEHEYPCLELRVIK